MAVRPASRGRITKKTSLLLELRKTEGAERAMGNDYVIGWADELVFESEPDLDDDSEFLGADLFEDVAVSADGNRAVTISLDFERGGPQMDYIVRLWNLETGEVVAKLARAINGNGSFRSLESKDQEAHGAPTPTYLLRFSFDSRRLLAVFDDGSVRVWNAEDGSRQAVFNTLREGSIGQVEAATFSTDGLSVAAGARSGTARIWNVQTGAVISNLLGHEGKVNCVCFSPSGKNIATCSDDGTARLWRVTDGRELIVFRGHTGPVKHIQLSPDGCFVVTASDDRTARLWDVVTGRVHMTFGGHEWGFSHGSV